MRRRRKRLPAGVHPASDGGAARAVAGQPAICVGFMQTHQPRRTATLDMDATLVETHKRDAPLLQGVQGISAAELLVGGARQDAVFGVPRWQCAGGTRAASGAARSVWAVRLRRASRRFRCARTRPATSEELLLYCGEGEGSALRRDRLRDRRRRDRAVPKAVQASGGDRVAAVGPHVRRQTAADRSGVGGSLLRAELGGAQPASGRTTGSWRSASRCANCRSAMRRNCRFPTAAVR